VPNEVLMRFAAAERERVPNALAIDIGCGAARNGVPLAEQGWTVLGTDLSAPMLAAAARRAGAAGQRRRVHLALAAMDALPARTQSADLVVAHGIWNLARSSAEFRRAVAEAARVSRPGAGLFIFTFSRHTLAADAEPVPGESFVFTQFSGEPQIFLTRDDIMTELGDAGFALDPAVPFVEYNRPSGVTGRWGGPPVIYEAAFRLMRHVAGGRARPANV
jgi:SAM-dependent methyltransferase